MPLRKCYITFIILIKLRWLHERELFWVGLFQISKQMTV